MKNLLFRIITVFLLPVAGITQSNLLPGLSTQPVSAYSLRKLSSSFAGSAIQVRRSSDNTTQDIGFTSAGDLDTAALKIFAGSNTCYVAIWYDQGSNGHNAIQTTAGNQPTIVVNGVINRENGQPSIFTSGTGFLVYSPLTEFNGLQPVSRMSVAKSRNGNTIAIIDGLGGYQLDNQILSSTTIALQVNSGSIVVNGTVGSTNSLMLLEAIRSSGASKLYVNGELKGTNTASLDNFGSSISGYIGIRNDGAGAGPGSYSESILFNSVLSDADRQLVEASQGIYYHILNPLSTIGVVNAAPVTAFSLRKLGNSYFGPAIQVRRSSDNTMQNIGFTSAGDLDTASLNSFVTTGSGFVSIWYDQSGKGHNAVQTTAGNQPTIVVNGVINRENGQPSIFTSGSGYLVYSSLTEFNGQASASRMSVAKSKNGNTIAIIDGLGSYQLDNQMLTSTTIGLQVNSGSIVVNGTVGNTNSLALLEAIRNNSASKLYIDGTLKGTNTASLGNFGSSISGYIGIRNDGAGAGPGSYSESILFNSVLADSNRQLIETNQKNYYQILKPLSTMGAVTAAPVAAFSLRRLGEGYSGPAIQVRRSSDNTMLSIGFTSAGDLDTTALKNFVTTGNGYVSIWYDQSGKGHNATQTTAGNQPTIVVNGIINRENSKPSIFTSATGYLVYSSLTEFNGLHTASRMSVARSRNGNTITIIDGLGSYQLDNQIQATISVQVNGGSILVNGTASNTNSLMLLGAIRNSGESKLYVNRVLAGTNTSSLGNFGSPISGYVGTRNDGGGAGPGSYAESILFNSVLSDGDRQLIDNNQKGYYQIRNAIDNIGTVSSSPVACYSLRKLSSFYAGSAIQVRRSSDNTTLDIGFTSTGDLDTTALKNFVTTGNGFVSIWYDQSGTDRNKTQTTNANQPQIISSGVIYRKNNQPVIFFSSQSNTGLRGASPDYLTSGDISFVFTAWSNSSTASVRRAIQGNTQNWLVGPYNNQNAWYAGGWNLQDGNNPWLSSGEIFVVLQPASGNNAMYRNGVSVLKVGNTNKGFPGSIAISAAGGNNEPFDGYMSELLEFNNALSATDKNAIEDNLGATNSIAVNNKNNLKNLWLNDKQGSGAYSLRLLNTTYAGPIVRIYNGTGFYDVYPDDNGIFSLNSPISASISTYNAAIALPSDAIISDITSGSTTAGVAVWYDQSGRKRDLVQSNTSYHPVIISSGAIIVHPDNGKPAIQFIAANSDYLYNNNLSADFSGMQDFSANAVVYQNPSGISSQFLCGVDRKWKIDIGYSSVNGLGAFRTSQDGTNWGTSAFFTNHGIASETKANSITANYNTTGASVYNNNIPVSGNYTSTGSLGSNSTPFQVSGSAGAASTNFWNGYIQEMVFVSPGLTEAEREKAVNSQTSYYKAVLYNSWTGVNNTNWSDACNWSKGKAPVAADNVFVPVTTNKPVISSSVAAPVSLVIAPNAVLTINSGGSFSGTSPKVQLLANSQYAAALINTAGITLDTVLFQKWITPQRGFRVLSYPFTHGQDLGTVGTSNNMLSFFSATTGTGSTSGTTPAVPSTTLSDALYFNNNAWNNIVNGNITANPYARFFRGVSSDHQSNGNTYISTEGGPNPFPYSIKGKINSGTNISVNAANSTTNFSIVGNPFTAPVKTSALTQGTNRPYYVYQVPVGNTATLRQTEAGQWVPYTSSDATLMPALTALAFKQTTASGSFTVPTSAMTISGTVESGAFRNAGNTLLLNPDAKNSKEKFLQIDLEEKGIFKDRFFVKLDKNATDEGKDDSDLEKLMNSDVSVYTLAADRLRMAVDDRKPFAKPVLMGLQWKTAGEYQFVVKQNNLNDASSLYLRDKLLQTETKLEVGATYRFSLDKYDTKAAENRFEIFNRYAKEEPVLPQSDVFTAVLLTNPVKQPATIKIRFGNTSNQPVTVQMNDATGRLLFSTVTKTNTLAIPIGKLPGGYVLIQCVNNNKKVILKAIVQE